MPEEMRIWIEIIFNITYLCVIWGLVGVMFWRRAELEPAERRQGNLAITAFGLLALGDTGHVGFRVLAYALGGLESSIQLLGFRLSLVGAGALMTAITVTLFYVLMLELWRTRFNRKYGWFEFILIGSAIIRLFIMIFPMNAWQSVVPPQPWSTVRNLPLIIQGLGLAYLIFREARKANDRTFYRIGMCILISYACYLPVILFVQIMPAIGMLMIPKTMAYVAIGFLIYHDLFQSLSVNSFS